MNGERDIRTISMRINKADKLQQEVHYKGKVMHTGKQQSVIDNEEDVGGQAMIRDEEKLLQVNSTQLSLKDHFHFFYT